jgi:aminopeptidase N
MRDSDTTAPRQPVRRENYQPPAWRVDDVELGFELGFDTTTVAAKLAVRRNPDAAAAPLVLDGEELELVSVALDGTPLDGTRYTRDERSLVLHPVGERALVETVVRIRPGANTKLEGLYRSGAFLLTQCEAEGFRHITYFPDRPDVMARYAVTLTADRETFPVLLANGNPAGATRLPDGRHAARWVDPFPKPSYLFALVAGRLDVLDDAYTGADGRTIRLRLFAEPDALPRCRHALACLKRAMHWDEANYGRSYDLDVFHIVATHDFNMGAMENKGLNIFNAKYVVAAPDTSTDDDFRHVEGVVAHEYFHNWTGNRVTCRDWFQLSRKEGLTVYRDQEFSADMGSRAVQRIEDVRLLRTVQFAEDAGPFAHPVRPDAYLEINNFYTATVYEKGAEIVRLLATVLGPAGFRKGTDLYFERHDGQAVTCDDFVRALGDANGRDLSAFMGWYAQAGTPQLRVAEAYDAEARRYRLTLSQDTPPTPGQADKRPLPIPVRLMLYAPDGTPLPLTLAGEHGAGATQRVLLLDGAARTFEFVDVPQRPVPSLLQGLSAPVQLHRDASAAELAFLARHDLDPVNRWDAIQRLGERAVFDAMAGVAPAESSWFQALAVANGALLDDPQADPAFVAECLVLPEQGYLCERIDACDPERLHHAHEAVRRALGTELGAPLARVREALADDPPGALDGVAVGRRRLKNTCLALLVVADPRGAADLARAQFAAAGNMTDRLAALVALVHNGVEGAQSLAEAFFRRYAHDPLVTDKWLTLQASNPQPGTLERVLRLTEHAAFTWKNPNKVRALIGSFARTNRVGFHAVSGAGYRFVGDAIRRLDALNPQVAARLAGAFNAWRRVEPLRRELMRHELERLAATPELSPDVAEIVQRALA